MLRFHELAPSPNNIKIFLGLRFKQIPFEVTPVDPMNRSALVEVSGQELSPVIEDKGIVLNESEAILNYLDANYRDTPRLFPSDRAGRKACDAWKAEIEGRIAPPWVDVFFHAIGIKPEFDPASPGKYQEALGWIEEALGQDEQPWPDCPVSELRIATWACYGLPGPQLLERVPLFGKFQSLYGVEAGRFPKLEALLAPWQERLA